MWVEAIRERLEDGTGVRHKIMHVGLDGHWQDKILLFCWRPDRRQPSLVCRLSRSRFGSAWLRREAVARQRARRRLPGPLRDAMPWVRTLDLPFGTVLVEPWMPGSCPPAPKSLAEISRYADRTLGWLGDLRDATRPQSPVSLARTTARMLELASRRLADPEIRDWVLARRAELGPLGQVAAACVHGDFWRGNLRQDGTNLRIIDWEFIQSAGNPYFDAALNLLAISRELPGYPPVTWFERCFLEPTEHSRLFGRLLDGYGIASRRAGALAVVLAVIEHAARDRAVDAILLRTLKYRLLARLSREVDPVGTVMRALWPDCPETSAQAP